MNDPNAMYRRQMKYMLNILAVFVLGWGFTDYKDIFLGLILGTAVSLFNLNLLARKVQSLTEAAVKQKRPKPIGMLTRMAAALLAVVIALKFPEYFHLYSVIFGIMTSYIVIMIDYFFYVLHIRKKQEER